MRSRKILEAALKDPSPDRDLSGLGLTRIYFKERLAVCRRVDLSKNKLSSVDTLSAYLLNCETLCLDDNPISSFGEFREGTPLREVSIRRTPLAENLDALLGLRTRHPSIKFIVD